MSLTDNAIKNAQPKNKKYKITDRDGLYLLVMPNGSKYFKYDFRFAGVKKEFSIGVYPKVSLKDARKKLFEAKSLLEQGINPNEVKKAEKLNLYADSINTLKNLAQEWFDANKSKWQTANEKWNKLEKNVLPYLGERPINNITAPELLSVIRKIEARGAIETAHRTKNIVREVYVYAVATGRAERNIASDLDGALLAKPPVVHRPAITNPDKIGRFLRVIDCYEGTLVVKSALQLSPYVMLRPVEVATAEWNDIDLINRIWKISAKKIKKRRTHIIPLAKQVVDLLAALLPLGSKYVFPSVRSKSKHMSASSVNAAIRDMGYGSEEMCAHGFRGMASTVLHENNFDSEIVNFQLAHVKKDKIDAAYNHAKYLPKRIEMMQWWADYLDRLRAEANN